jgi:UDP-N-acetyl-D-glucosamine dehydrogenase
MSSVMSTRRPPHAGEKVVIVGQGYVGLPVAVSAAEYGFEVVGLDVDRARVDELRNGRSYVEDVDSARLRDVIASRRYISSSDYSDAANFDVAVITVPTPLRETLPDLSFIEDAARRLAPHLRSGATVILESTTYPGTTEQLLVPILEAGSSLVAGRDFHVGYSPERIDPGNPVYGFSNTPKVVSGIDDQSLKRVTRFYATMVEELVPVRSPKEAELTKLLENTFRHVNIALVNELAVFAHQLGIDIWEAIRAASSKPFGFMPFTPGPGVGGHCLPVDPSYLSWQVRRQLGQSFRFIELANDVNDHMPKYVVQRLVALLNDASKPVRDSQVLLVGLAYKKDTGDIRESPALKIVSSLQGMGATVKAVDAHVEAHRWPTGVESVKLTLDEVSSSDIAVLLTAHTDVDHAPLAAGLKPVLDTRHALEGPRVTYL